MGLDVLIKHVRIKHQLVAAYFVIDGDVTAITLRIGKRFGKGVEIEADAGAGCIGVIRSGRVTVCKKRCMTKKGIEISGRAAGETPAARTASRESCRLSGLALADAQSDLIGVAAVAIVDGVAMIKIEHSHYLRVYDRPLRKPARRQIRPSPCRACSRIPDWIPLRDNLRGT